MSGCEHTALTLITETHANAHSLSLVPGVSIVTYSYATIEMKHTPSKICTASQ